MQHCPKCHFPLSQPPEDIQDWFRCEHCQTPLRVPSDLGRILFFAGSFGALVVFWTFEYYGARYYPRIFRWMPEATHAVLFGLPLILYGWLARFMWKTKLSAPKVYDPYSALNLSDDKTKLRGH
jgi:hypothetical protein